jgi:hypothetical protein
MTEQLHARWAAQLGHCPGLNLGLPSMSPNRSRITLASRSDTVAGTPAAGHGTATSSITSLKK